MPDTSRNCGTCGACCKIYDISEPTLTKPAGSWCAHWKRESGCGIYHERPKICRTFQCAWLQGHGEDKDRPDRTKVVMDFTPPLSPEMLDGVLRMSEVSVGSLSSPYAKQMMEGFLKQNVFVCHMYLNGKRKLYSPKTRFLSTETQNQLTALGIEIVR